VPFLQYLWIFVTDFYWNITLLPRLSYVAALPYAVQFCENWHCSACFLVSRK